MYVKIESKRFRYLRLNKKELRAKDSQNNYYNNYDNIISIDIGNGKVTIDESHTNLLMQFAMLLKL
jgi:hypothetical protein